MTPSDDVPDPTAERDLRAEIMALKYDLDAFEQVWPTFEQRGFSRDAALIAYTVGEMARSVFDLSCALERPDPPDDGEAWKQGGR